VRISSDVWLLAHLVADDVCMLELPENVDLAHKHRLFLFVHSAVANLLPHQHLAVLLADNLADRPEGSRPKLLEHLILVHGRFPLRERPTEPPTFNTPFSLRPTRLPLTVTQTALFCTPVQKNLHRFENSKTDTGGSVGSVLGATVGHQAEGGGREKGIEA
jgi:hypothetical protein